MMSPREFLAEIEAFIERHRLSATEFGRLSANDPRLVGDLRRGREPRRKTMDRVCRFMADTSEMPLRGLSENPSRNYPSTAVHVDAALIEEARALSIDPEQAVNRLLAEHLADARAAAWKEENAQALAASNDYVAEHGLPLARHRRF